MLIFIDTHSGVPIYDQIYTQIKALIIRGEVKENDMLPSIRSLAKELRISVITTKRAYDELEKEGYVYTVPAKGCFVAKRNTELIKEQSIMKLEEMILKFLHGLQNSEKQMKNRLYDLRPDK